MTYLMRVAVALAAATLTMGLAAACGEGPNLSPTDPNPGSPVIAETTATYATATTTADITPQTGATTTTEPLVVDVVPVAHCAPAEPLEGNAQITEAQTIDLAAGTYAFAWNGEGNGRITSLDHPDTDFGIGYQLLSDGTTSTDVLAGGGYRVEVGRGGTMSVERLR